MARKRSKGSKRPIEAYQHTEHKRLNNPPAGLVTPETDPEGGKKSYRYDPHLDPELNFDSRKIRDELTEVIEQGLKAETLDQAKEALKTLKKAQEPYLNWAGKAEHTSFEVPTVSLHVHERIDPRTIIEAVRRRNGEQSSQPSLFKLEEKPLRQAIEFYKHKEGWKNRLIAGDSLLVMNSLLEKEGMAGKVQMIYIDPPYGIKYASNFQPFVNKRDVKDGKDEDLTSEPEQIKAFRDTWELGIHSYLTYLRDRLLLARELLHESGSIFVQINDENLHLVRCLMDEVFGRENFVAVIPFVKTTGKASITIDVTFDFLLWYACDKTQMKYRQLTIPRSGRTRLKTFTMVETTEGLVRRVKKGENLDSLVDGVRVFGPQGLYSDSGSDATRFSFELEDQAFRPLPGYYWRTTQEGLKRLAEAGRLVKVGKYLRWKQYESDFRFMRLTALWIDTMPSGFAGEASLYATQTSTKVVERCILMTTDPGDLVFDPTCGSGTTAYVAEKWGRRWITCDTSRVAIAIARQRLMTAVFDYYELAHPEEGVSSGFKYKTVPHITLRSIVHNEEIDQIAAKYQPQIDQALADLNRALGKEWKEWEVPRLRPHPLWPDEVKKAWDLLQSKRDEEAALGNPPAEAQAALETLNRYFGEKYTLATLPDPVPGDDWPEEAQEAIRRFWDLKQKKRKEIEESIQRHAPQETLYDQPYVDRKKVRVTGPFTVEAVPAPAVKSVDEILEGEPPVADASVARSGETLRQAEWRDELFKTGIRGKAGQRIRFASLEPLPGCRWLHAIGETRPSDEGANSVHEPAPAYNPMRVVVSFGPEHAPLEPRQVELALQEAQRLVPKPQLIVFAAFQFDPEAAKDIDETKWPGVTLLKVQMNADLLTEDLKKKRASNESFWLIGQPDVHVERIEEGPDAGKYRASVHGFDYYNTKTGTIESGGPDKIAIWMLDTDYDGRSLFPRQVFFPMAGKNEGWAKLARSLKAEIDPELIETYSGTVSLPFEAGEHRRIAVKIVDDRGIESLKVVELDA